jgi:hypothetical protein
LAWYLMNTLGFGGNVHILRTNAAS